MKHQGIQTRLNKVKSKTRRRDKPWIIEVRHGEPMPEDHDGILVLRFPDPSAPPPTIDRPARINRLRHETG